MKNHKRGFITPLLIMIVLIVIGGIAYYIYSTRISAPSTSGSSQSVNTPSDNNSVPFVNAEMISISGPYWNNEKTKVGFIVTKETAKEYEGSFYQLQKSESNLAVFAYPSFSQFNSFFLSNNTYQKKNNLDCEVQGCWFSRSSIFLWEGNKLALKLIDVDYINKRSSPNYYFVDIGSKEVKPIQLSLDWQVTEGIPFSAQSGATYFNADKLLEVVKNNSQMPHKLAFNTGRGEVLSNNKIVSTTEVKKVIWYNAGYHDSAYKQYIIPENVIEKLTK